MEAAELRAVMLALELGYMGMADALDIDVRRVRAYVSGGKPIPKVVSLAVWALSMQPRVGAVRKLLEV